jgi:hypothetical protein
MSELDDAMLQQMAYIVFDEKRPFCVNDFLYFECNGKPYKPKSGTIRNKFSDFSKKGDIEFCFYDINAYYTLKGQPFGKKSMTLDHTGGKTNNLTSHPNHPLYKTLQRMVLDKEAIHNIRLRLEIPNFFIRCLGTLHYFEQNEISRDFKLPYWNIDGSQVQVRIHKTDTITVIIGCSVNPIPLDHTGLIRLYKILGIAQGYLEGLTFYDNVIHIPDCDTWTITMWHFNRDGLKEYAGEKFSITVDKARNTIERIYSKDFNGKTRIRKEIQKYPNKTVKETINDKLRISISNDVDVDVDVPNIDINVPDSVSFFLLILLNRFLEID